MDRIRSPAHAAIWAALAAASVGTLFTCALAARGVATEGQHITPAATFSMGMIAEFAGLLRLPVASLFWAVLACCAVALLCIATSALVLVRAADTPPNRQMAALLAACAWMLLLRVLPAFFDALPRKNPVLFELQWALSGSIAVYLLLGLTRFLLLFPRAVDAASVEHTFLARRRRAKWLDRTGPAFEFNFRPWWHRELVGGRALWVLAVSPLVFWAVGAMARSYVQDGWWRGAYLFCFVDFLVFYFFFALPFGMASPAHLRRYGSQDERQRAALLRSVMVSVVIVLVAAALLIPVLGLLSPPAPKVAPAKPLVQHAPPLAFAVFAELLFWIFVPEFIVLAVAFAVVRGGALDARVALTRATLWSIAGALLAVLFVLAERWIALWLTEWLGVESQSGSLLAGALVAATFLPIRKKASRLVEAAAHRLVPLQEQARGERLPLAVAVVDICGYTALSARDEAQAILQGAALTRACVQVAEEHRGRRVKGLGDAALLAFPGPRDAAMALPVIHERFRATVQALGLDPLPLHSGMHCGEVVVAADGDVFGQTVNIASRLADAAKPGEILLTAEACAALEDPRRALSVGVRTFKNVPKPVECFAIG